MEYYDLYVQSDTLLLADVFGNFRNMCLNTYELDPVYFVSAPGLAWQAYLKKIGVKLEFLTDNYMLMMIEKGTRGEYVMQYKGMQKQTISIRKIMTMAKDHLIHLFI